MTLPTIKEYIINSISAIYDEQETLAIANTLLSHVLSDSVVRSFDNITPAKLEPTNVAKIEEAVKRLLRKEPLQYVLEEAWFYNLPFYVNRHVLIPRPETEELVDWVINSCPNSYQEMHQTPITMLDIGTGSGCIPVALKKHFQYAHVFGLDISENALTVAEFNAKQNGVEVTFLQGNILMPESISLPKLDIIVSNPPYITESEKKEMHPNVLEHEPHLALFVADTNPLQFYEAIARYASANLKNEGHLFVEINASYASEVKACMENCGFTSVTVMKDMQGKDRFVSGQIHVKKKFDNALV